MVDIGDDDACVGDTVNLIGKDNDQEITVSDIAQLCNTIPYEILCGLNSRIPRLYITNATQVWDTTDYSTP